MCVDVRHFLHMKSECGQNVLEQRGIYMSTLHVTRENTDQTYYKLGDIVETISIFNMNTSDVTQSHKLIPFIATRGRFSRWVEFLQKHRIPYTAYQPLFPLQ